MTQAVLRLIPVSSPTWRISARVIAWGVLLPVLAIAALALGVLPNDAGTEPATQRWAHLLRYTLPDALGNTALLLAGVACFVLLTGVSTAWLVSRYDFPARRVLHWALLLPLAIPSYILAYVYLDVMHPLGMVQESLRWLLGISNPRDLRLPDFRNLYSAIMVLGLALYPYVYMTARAAFISHPQHLQEAARTLGCGAAGAFFRVALPVARPAIVVGLTLALLEALNDIGASEFLGVNTLTVTIYTTWVTRSDLAGAAQLACGMLAVVLGFVWLEHKSRTTQAYYSTTRSQPLSLIKLRGWRAASVLGVVSLPVLLGFAVPVLHLLAQVWQRARESALAWDAWLAHLGNTVGVALGVTVIAALVAVVVIWAARANVCNRFQPRARWLLRASSLGYALPGTVLAIGMLPLALWVDNAVASALGWSHLPMLGAGMLLVCACVIRFLAMPVGSLDAALQHIPPSLEQAARLLGAHPSAVLMRVHLPLLRTALFSSALLVFVDAMKELPVTLLLRPSNFETLATALYAQAARGTYEDGALSALTIVAAGLIPVLMLANRQQRTQQVQRY